MSDEYLALFRGVMSDYLKIVKNNSFVAIRSEQITKTKLVIVFTIIQYSTNF